MKKIVTVVVVLVLLTSFAAFAQYVEVKVRSGWTLWDIATDFNMSVSDLMRINDLEETTIYPDQKLKVFPYYDDLVVVSYYGPGDHGDSMANGKKFDMYDSTVVAHKWLPFGTRVKLTRKDGRSVIVTVQDRGPYPEGRNFDLSLAAAKKIGMIDEGVIECRVDILS